MSKKYAPKKSREKFVVFTTFLLLLSIPIIIYGLLQESFDTRDKAFDDLEVTEETPCIISLPNVNPYTLEVGKSVRVLVDAELENKGITALEIVDSSGNKVYEELYKDSPFTLSTSFVFTPSKSGTVDLLGALRTTDGTTVGCTISSPYDIKGLTVIENNSKPLFTSYPSSSTPSQDIKTGTEYEYKMTASDEDKDRINYSFSFTPGSDWLKPTIISDGSNGDLEITFRGSTNVPGSYLAYVLIHDGYSTHLSTQSWVISVSPAENDIPIVSVISPAESTRITVGDVLKVSWEAVDLNHISNYEIYLTKYPTVESKWIAVDTKIQYNRVSYEIDTSSYEIGTYYVIVRAVDNQNPSASGLAISPEVVIAGLDGFAPNTEPLTEEEQGDNDSTEDKEDTITKDDEDVDDEVYIGKAQVTNMSPSSSDTVTNQKVIVKGTVIGSKGATIDENTIVFLLDNSDITSKVKISKVSTNEYTLIYQPDADLGLGEHKAEITFSDSNEESATRSWIFTITSNETNTTDTNSDYYTIFGYSISKKIVMIIAIGIVVILLALLAPFIISSVWKEDAKRKKGVSGSQVLPTTPSDNGMYSVPTENTLVKEKVKMDLDEIKKIDNDEDVFTAPSPENIAEYKNEANDNKNDVRENIKDDINQEEKKNEVVESPVIEPAIVEPAIPVVEEKSETIEEPPLPSFYATPSSDEDTETVNDDNSEDDDNDNPDVEDLQKVFEQIQKQEGKSE